MAAVSPLRSGFLQVVSIFLVLTLPHVVLSVDMQSASHSPCFEVKNTTALDLNWAYSVKDWYYPAMCRSDLYHMAGALLQVDPLDIPEHELYYKGCMSWEFDNKCAILNGFGGKRREYKMRSTSGLRQMDFYTMDTNRQVGTCYTTLTDNKSFFVSACCYGNQMTWGTSSKFQVLPKKTIKMIRQHAEDLGFYKENFTGMRYDTC